MANTSPRIGRIGGGTTLRMRLPVAAGSSQTIAIGEICYNNSGTFTPITADADYAGDIVVCDDEVKSTDLAGYRYFFVPDERDIFKLQLSAAAAVTRGTPIGWGGSSILVATGTNNPFGSVLDHGGYPREQGHADVGDVADRGSTIADTNWVEMTFARAESYMATLAPLAV